MREVKAYQFRVEDPITGRRYLTRYELTKEEAAKRFPGDELIDCIEITEGTRTVHDGDVPISSHQIVFGRAKENVTLQGLGVTLHGPHIHSCVCEL